MISLCFNNVKVQDLHCVFSIQVHFHCADSVFMITFILKNQAFAKMSNPTGWNYPALQPFVSQMVADTLFRPPEDWLTTIWTRNIELHLSIRPVASDFKFLCNLAQLGFSPCFPSLKACLPLRPFLQAFVKSRSINWKPRCISDLDTVDKPATYPFSSLHIILKDVLRFGNCLSDAKMQFYVC